MLKIARRLDLLDGIAALVAYQDRCLDRSAFRKAVEDQCATIVSHGLSDMRFEEVKND